MYKYAIQKRIIHSYPNLPNAKGRWGLVKKYKTLTDVCNAYVDFRGHKQRYNDIKIQYRVIQITKE